MNGQYPSDVWVFYINSENNSFTRIKVNDYIITNITDNGETVRIDQLDAIQSIPAIRILPTDMYLTSDIKTVTSGIFVNITARIVQNTNLAVNARGTVTFYNNDIELGTAPVINGTAIISNVWHASGTYQITGIYSGDGVTSEAVTSDTLTVNII
jgi:hypothetical protein